MQNGIKCNKNSIKCNKNSTKGHKNENINTILGLPGKKTDTGHNLTNKHKSFCYQNFLKNFRLHIGVSYELSKVNQATQSNAYARKTYDATHLPRFDAMGKDIIQKRHKN